MLLLAFGLAKGIVWAAMVPQGEAYDETVYIQEIAMVAQEHRIPGITGPRLTGHTQLYSVAAAPFFILGSPWGEAGRIFSIRFFGVLLSLVVVYFGYATAALVFPGNRFVPLATATFLLLHPGSTFVMSSINSDTLLNAFAALFFWQSALLVRFEISLKRVALLFLIIAGGLLTKERFWFAVALLGILGFVVAIRAILRRRTSTDKQGFGGFPIAALLLVALPLLLFGSIFNRLFGSKFLGAVRPVINQAMDPAFRIDMFKYFWGFFSWLTIPMTDRIYRLLALLVILGVLGCTYALIGFVKKIASETDSSKWNSLRVDTLILLPFFALSTVLMYYALAAYHFYSGGGEGRYLFVVLVPIFTLLSWGLSELVPERFWSQAFMGLFGAMFALNMVALYNFVIPYYY